MIPIPTQDYTLLSSVSLPKCLQTLLLKLNINLLLEPPEMPCDIDIHLPPCGLFTFFYSSYVLCVGYAMCDCRLLLPVLARKPEEMFNLNDDYYFQLANSSCLAF